jgi:hypothetical protein
MTIDPLKVARRRRATLRRNDPLTRATPTVDCEISEKSEKSQASGGLISHNSLFSQPVAAHSVTDDPLLRARQRIRDLRVGTPNIQAQPDTRYPGRSDPIMPTFGGLGTTTDCEISEKSEERAGDPPASAHLPDPFRAWRLRNAELLAQTDGRPSHDYGGFCATHHRSLSYPEQKRGACSWCLPVDPEREPEYWESHWRRFMERP